MAGLGADYEDRTCQCLFGCRPLSFDKIKCSMRAVLADPAPFKYRLEGTKPLEGDLLTDLVAQCP